MPFDSPPVRLDEKQILFKARQLIENECDWSHHGMESVDSDGHRRICLELAIRSAGWPNTAATQDALMAVAKLVPDYSIGPWNDTHSHAEVLALVDRAVARIP
jgi:hypothetical protein